jgi:Ni/Co efflux regulator RcnB
MHIQLTLMFLIAMFTTATAVADPPPWAGSGKGHHERGKGKGKGHDRDEDHERRRDARAPHFVDDHRIVVREYYEDEYRRGKCPPGLAKKRNGCMPPGQAKKWRVGKRLPWGLVYYEVPRALVVKLGTPPPGHRYVRVGADILLIAFGTGIVVDAIQDLGRM